MKIIIQRVSEAAVVIDNKQVAIISKGLLILVGIIPEDNEDTIDWVCHKIVNMRIFADEQGLMNKSVKDIDGEILVVSQFTLYADALKGNRPSFIKAASAEIAIPIYNKMMQQLQLVFGKQIQAGVFGADMKVSSVNDGPVTIVLEK